MHFFSRIYWFLLFQISLCCREGGKKPAKHGAGDRVCSITSDGAYVTFLPLSDGRVVA